MPIYSESQLNNLCLQMSAILSEKRMKHVIAVEKMAKRLGELYFTDEDSLAMIRAAAFLHDNTKELTDSEQLKILSEHSVEPLSEELASMPTIHALTGSLVIKVRYPEFADGEVIDAVRYHTTGREGMSLYEKIIFLADYIDETRTYPSCVALRNEFFDAEPQNMSGEERIAHLDRVILKAIENTLSHLRAEGKAIHPATLKAYDDLKERLGDEAR